VHIHFLELYGKFLEKYGHSDQNDYISEIKRMQQPSPHMSFYA